MARDWTQMRQEGVKEHAGLWAKVFGETFTCADFTMALLQHAEPLLPSDVKDDQITVTLKPGEVKGVKQGRAHGAAVGYEITGPKSLRIELTLYRRADATEEREIYIDERNFSGLGGGAGKKFHRNLLPVCDAQKITCFSNLPSLSGTFVWPRFGFVPAADGWKQIRQEAQGRMEVLQAQGLLGSLSSKTDREGVAIIEHALQEEAPAAIRRLAYPKAPKLAGAAAALPAVAGLPDPCALSYALLYNNLFWSVGGGTLDLNDTATRAYHKAYITGNGDAVRQQLGIAEMLKNANPKTASATEAATDVGAASKAVVEAETDYSMYDESSPSRRASTESATGTG